MDKFNFKSENNESVLQTINFINNLEDDGTQRICSECVGLYSSFINSGRRIVISHGRFISSYDMIKEQWEEDHLEFDDDVRQLFRSKTSEAEDKLTLGILVGYKTFRFLHVGLSSSKYHLSENFLTVEHPICKFVNDLDKQQAFYII